MAEFDAKHFVSHAPSLPGVYRMYDSDDTVIYVGKAKSLKKRLASYFRKSVDTAKTQALVSQICRIEITITHTETEALLLEHTLIKKYLPRYNVLLRDDKSYPYILLTDHRHPRLMMHRGAKRVKGRYFGPYPNGKAVRESLILMQKLFPLRQCSDSEYANRTRPCLQYQMKRCSGPCCDLVSDEFYQNQVQMADLFLSGKGSAVIDKLVTKMQLASDNLEFELAARYRDQIQSLRRVQEQQWVSGTGAEQTDVIGFDYQNGIAAIHLMMFRDGQLFGSRSYFPKVPKDTDLHELLRSFIVLYYLSEQRQGQFAKQILINQADEEWEPLQETLSQKAGFKVSIHNPSRGEKVKLLNLAMTNAQMAVTTKLHQSSTATKRLKALQAFLEIEQPVERMECFDISHTQGESTVASCVVFNQQGPNSSEYRRYNIEGIQGGDDYAAMAQALRRRYSKQEDDAGMPDIVFIDGGKGQLNAAYEVIESLPLERSPLLVGIAKGVSRKPGLETLLIGRSMREVHLDKQDPALHLIQHIRDESHRFAISGHRARRGKSRQQSFLEGIPGIGAKKRQALLKYLGGMQEVKRASVQELAKVPGIGLQLAQTVHDALQE